MNETPAHTPCLRAASRADRGFTLVEVLIVIVIVGILSSVSVFAVRAITDRGEEASCTTDYDVLEMATDWYFANEQTDTLPASGSGDNRFERGLVDAGVLREASTLHNLAADGTITIADPICN